MIEERPLSQPYRKTLTAGDLLERQDARTD
jgi:hypothetical protein